MRQFDQKAAHKRCSLHRDVMEKSATAGCFYCLAVFPPTEVKEWIDGQTTALCPKCGIDSVIPSTPEFPVDEDVLRQMEAHWFADAPADADADAQD